ncbi:MAG: hypothetical protein ACXIUM_01280 [Wenzhouxiangella sp.]
MAQTITRIPLHLKLCLLSFAVAAVLALLSLIGDLRAGIALPAANANAFEAYALVGLGRHALMLLTSLLCSWLILTKPGRTALWSGRLGVLLLLLLTLAGLPELFHRINIGMQAVTSVLPVALALSWLLGLLISVLLVRAQPAARI